MPGNPVSASSDFERPVFSQLTSAIRAVAMDAVQNAGSGHPGMPMGMAEIAEVLWNHHLRHNPANPQWPNRDRFVLSNGHGSLLLYALLHLTGYDLPMDELRRFRQLHSKTPGHPEYGHTPGVETTTGPLGQGLANAVGMALAEKLLAQEFNRPGLDIVDHHTYVFLGDGCLMEGISHEVCSLAGTLGLGKLICLYDDNGISIDGKVEGWFTDDTPKRFDAYGWHVVAGVDGHDPEAIQAAIMLSKADADRPSLICCKTVIGHGAPTKAGSHESHGSPLGEAEIAATRPVIGWHHPPFEIPEEVYAGWDARARGAELEEGWNATFAEYRSKYPLEAAEFERRTSGELPGGWQEKATAVVESTNDMAQSVATRKASQNAIEALAPFLPELLGGSADLTGSNLTNWSGSMTVSRGGGGNYLSYGVREFGMAAIMNGLTLHGGFIPYGGTFLMFSEYARNAIRMAALMKVRSIFVLTHDSIGMGEDGPTHQAVEQTATLRLMPHLDVWRPCDSVETAVAWTAAIERADGPTALVLSRQSLPFQPRDPGTRDQIRRGGYLLRPSEGIAPSALLLATGSEVGLAIAAQQALAQEDIPVWVVSMPCTDVFDRQESQYQEAVLPRGVPRVAIEAGVSDGWRKYVLDGAVIGIDTFGESAPGVDLLEYFGFTVENVVKAVKGLL
jgi:transketolase